VFPVLFWASRAPVYPRLIMGVGSFLVAWVAAVWTIERATGMAFFR